MIHISGFQHILKRLGLALATLGLLAGLTGCPPAPTYTKHVGDFDLRSEQVSGTSAQWRIVGFGNASWGTIYVDFGLVGTPPNVALVGDLALLQEGAFGPTGNGVISTTNLCVTARGTDDGPWIRCGVTNTWSLPPSGSHDTTGSINWGPWQSFGGVCWSNVVVPRDLSPFESAYAACGSPFGVVAAQAFSVNFGLKVAIPSGGWFSLGGSPLLIGVHTYAAPTLSQVYSSGVWTDQFIQTFTDNQQYVRTPSTPWTPYHQ